MAPPTVPVNRTAVTYLKVLITCVAQCIKIIHVYTLLGTSFVCLFLLFFFVSNRIVLFYRNPSLLEKGAHNCNQRPSNGVDDAILFCDKSTRCQYLTGVRINSTGKRSSIVQISVKSTKFGKGIEVNSLSNSG